MDSFGDGAIAIIAGASGLVGREVLTQLLDKPAIQAVHAIVRNPLANSHPKLHQLQDADLRVTEWHSDQPPPDFGFICLGTTRKQAGSKKALAHVDYELVCQVAQSMKLLGVKRIAVVSSYGAKHNALSHYLRCKGKMEKAILAMDFERVVFVRPGPLKGKRNPPRTDEIVIGKILHLLSPIMRGPLANLKQIDAFDVAQGMLFSTFRPMRKPADHYITLTSRQIWQLQASFDIHSHSD